MPTDVWPGRDVAGTDEVTVLRFNACDIVPRADNDRGYALEADPRQRPGCEEPEILGRGSGRRTSSFDCLLWLISCRVLETGQHGAAPGVFKQELLKEEL
jgi:hypothetical protein